MFKKKKKYALGTQNLQVEQNTVDRTAQTMKYAGMGSEIGGMVGNFIPVPGGQVIGMAGGALLGGLGGYAYSGVQQRNENNKNTFIRQINDSYNNQNMNYGGVERQQLDNPMNNRFKNTNSIGQNNYFAEKGSGSLETEGVVEVEDKETIFRRDKLNPNLIKLVGDMKGGNTHAEGGEDVVLKQGDIIFPKNKRGILDFVLDNGYVDPRKINEFEQAVNTLPEDTETKDMYAKGTKKLKFSNLNNDDQNNPNDPNKKDKKIKSETKITVGDNKTNSTTKEQQNMGGNTNTTPIQSSKIELPKTKIEASKNQAENKDVYISNLRKQGSLNSKEKLQELVNSGAIGVEFANEELARIEKESQAQAQSTSNNGSQKQAANSEATSGGVTVVHTEYEDEKPQTVQPQQQVPQMPFPQNPMTQGLSGSGSKSAATKEAATKSGSDNQFKKPIFPLPPAELESPNLKFNPAKPNLNQYEDMSDPMRREIDMAQKVNNEQIRNLSAGNTSTAMNNLRMLSSDAMKKQMEVENQEAARLNQIQQSNVGILNQFEQHNNQGMNHANQQNEMLRVQTNNANRQLNRQFADEVFKGAQEQVAYRNDKDEAVEKQINEYNTAMDEQETDLNIQLQALVDMRRSQGVSDEDIQKEVDQWKSAYAGRLKTVSNAGRTFLGRQKFNYQKRDIGYNPMNAPKLPFNNMSMAQPESLQVPQNAMLGIGSISGMNNKQQFNPSGQTEISDFGTYSNANKFGIYSNFSNQIPSVKTPVDDFNPYNMLSPKVEESVDYEKKYGRFTKPF